MRPLASAPPGDWTRARGILADIDDTLTVHGRLTGAVVAAMERLRAAGLLMVPITGRPAGWCDMIARQWPVDAVVGENGAFYFRHDAAARRMIRRFADAPEARADKRRRLAALAETILAAVPGAALAADQPYRETDLAIDFREDAGPLDASAVAGIVRLFEAGGATAKISSIHVNGWFGAYDKLTMTRRLLAEAFGVGAEAGLADFVFIGDSPNDAPMFGAFETSVGVANVRDFADRCPALPRYVTEAAEGAGFVELVDTVLAARARAVAPSRVGAAPP